MSAADFITPDWPAPSSVKALVTTRQGGYSKKPFAGFNLAEHVGDNQTAVYKNRQLLRQYLPAEPAWLNQTHSNVVVNAGELTHAVNADGSFSNRVNTVAVVLTADCLPVLVCNKQGSGVAALHAGWRGLANGIIEQGVMELMNATGSTASDILVWLGPAIGPEAFEVGDDVRQQFLRQNQAMDSAFKKRVHGNTRDHQPKWLANLYQLARLSLAKTGIENFYGGNRCTYIEKELFYSYRRDGTTGRMASMIWLAES